MHWNTILAQATTPPATTSSATSAAPPQGSPFGMLFPMVLFGVAIYFLMIRPQSQQRKKQMKLLEALKSGDKVVTASGIHGVVVTVKENTVSIRSHESKMEVAKSSITQILEEGTAPEVKPS